MRTIFRAPLAVVFPVVSLLACVVAAACGNAGTAGGVGEDCYPNGTCNAGLTCQGGVCAAGQTSGTGGASGSSGSGSVTGSGSGSTGGAGGQSTTTTSGGTGGQTASVTTSVTATGSTSSGTTNGPPVIVTLGTDVSTITQGQSVTITAVVTDPDGIGDVIGGTLMDDTNDTYGAFATSSQEGSYQMVVSWAQIQQVKSIDFAEGATQSRTFIAQFYDQAAHMVQKSLSITLTCMGHGACMGVCKNMSADVANCGTCGNTCASGATCAAGSCACPAGDTVCSGVCRNTQTDPANCGACGHSCGNAGCYQGVCGALSPCSTGHTSCNAACAAIGKTCHEECASATAGLYFGGIETNASTCSAATLSSMNCNAVYASVYSAKCCCF